MDSVVDGTLASSDTPKRRAGVVCKGILFRHTAADFIGQAGQRNQQGKALGQGICRFVVSLCLAIGFDPGAAFQQRSYFQQFSGRKRCTDFQAFYHIGQIPVAGKGRGALFENAV